MELENGGEPIAVGFTVRKLSPHAGSAVFRRFPHSTGVFVKLKQLWRHLPESNNAIQPIDQAVAFVQGLHCGAEKLTHVAFLRSDPVVPALTGIQCLSSQNNCPPRLC